MGNYTLGNRIRNLREEKSISQLELAKILNIGNTTLSQYESDKRIPSDTVKKKIADYFNVSTDYLLGRSDIRNPYTEKGLNEMNLSEQDPKQSTNKDDSEILAERFLDMLIDIGEIKTKEDLTSGKALKILSKIFKELEEDTK
ncbi:helix-turn-helix domain-containing protein [Clostridium sp.]|uniref:helix-turn-helix domain-containing protein n=1 Tax=Clostridium sp. TaxID=1506 RepID=UPI0035A0FEFD